jgi:hypothetical protein
MARIRRVAGHPPRIVRTGRISEQATSIVQAASGFADQETKANPMVGYVIMAVYKGGAVNKEVYHADMGHDGMGTDMFWALADTGLQGLRMKQIAEHVFADRHNEAHDLTPS